MFQEYGELDKLIKPIVCSKCKERIKKIVRIYKREAYRDERGNHEETTLRAVFNTNGFTEMTFQYPTGYAELSTEDSFKHKVEREGLILISEEFEK